MKKVILSAMLIATSLVFFSFKPMDKSVGSFEKVEGATEVNLKGWTQYYDHGTTGDKGTWSTYNNHYTYRVSTDAQVDILNKY